MSRIAGAFGGAAGAGRKLLVGYLTAGDPDMVASEAAIRAALDNGVDILELGVPFSDPTADGPTIQEASRRSLAAGTSVHRVIELVRRLRADYSQPIVLFGYANPFLAYGYEALCRDVADAGGDGLLVVDLPFEEREELKCHADPAGLDLIPLVAPTTPPERMARILADATGFVYYVMVTGVTGQRAEVAADLGERVALLREQTQLPIAVGFGVGSGEQARVAGEGADAVVVGSALVKAAQGSTLPSLVSEIATALRSA
jgi:tryptophan synthase alpha chain